MSGKTTKTGGLGLEISDEDLREYFSQFGNVVSVKQIINKDTGKHKVGDGRQALTILKIVVDYYLLLNIAEIGLCFRALAS